MQVSSSVALPELLAGSPPPPNSAPTHTQPELTGAPSCHLPAAACLPACRAPP
jgi:hypothetical protein